MSVEITLELPDDLVQDAREFGILDESTLIDLITRELDRRVNKLVNEEVHTYRAEKRNQQRPQQK